MVKFIELLKDDPGRSVDELGWITREIKKFLTFNFNHHDIEFQFMSQLVKRKEHTKGKRH